MNMAWTTGATSTSFRALSTLHSRRKVIHEINPHPGRRGRADPVTRRRLAGASAIRPHSPGADGLPPQMNACLRANKEKLSDGCRKVVESHGG
jgi:hypothetical protein